MSPETLLQALGFTVLVTVASFLVAAVLGTFVVAARRSAHRVPRAIAGAWIAVLRGVPPVVWMFIVFFGITIGAAKFTPTSAAIITFGVVYSAYLAEAYRAGLESVPKAQREALDALGIPRLASMRLVVLPQALPVIVSTCSSYAINLLKDTAVASLIGVQELTYAANDTVQRGADGFQAFFLLGLAYLALSVPMGVLARSIERRSENRKTKVA